MFVQRVHTVSVCMFICWPVFSDLVLDLNHTVYSSTVLHLHPLEWLGQIFGVPQAELSRVKAACPQLVLLKTHLVHYS